MKTLFMNRNLIVLLSAVMLLTYSVQGISYAQEAPDTIVEFKDINLAIEIRIELGLTTRGVDLLKIPKAELVKLTNLSTWYEDITDLTGLEHATQLKVLKLEGEDVSDITPLTQLTQLTVLSLYNNEVSDITPLAQLTQLTELNLAGNNINDITLLAGLTQLTNLNLSSESGANNVSDLTPLAGLTQLTNLNLYNNNVSDLTPLAGLTQLTNLNLYSNNVSDLTPLAGLTQLTELDLRYNNIRDVTPLAGLTQLTELNLRKTNVSDLTPLAHLKKLKIRTGPYSFSSIFASDIPLIEVTSTQPLVEAKLNGSSVTLTLLRDGTTYDVSTDNIINALTVSGIDGVTVSSITRMSDTEIEVVLEFTGNFDAINTLTFAIEPEAISGFESRALTGKIKVNPGGGPAAINASTPYPLTETTLNGSIITLKLTGEDYSFTSSSYSIRPYVKVSGIKGGTIAREWARSATYQDYEMSNVVRKVSGTEIMVELRFSGSIDTDATLVFTVDPDAIDLYNGPPLTAEITVSATTKVEPTGDLVASTPFPLTKATLDGSPVVLTLQNRSYAYRADTNNDDGDYIEYLDYDNIRYVGISGIHDVQTADSYDSPYDNGDVIRLSSSEILVQIDFQGDFDTDVTLTFTVPAGIIENYDGPPLTAELPVSAVTEVRVLSSELQGLPMFWVNTQTGKIGSSEYFDAITNEVTVLTVNRANQKLYWGERSNSGGVIKRADFDGRNVETLATLTNVPRGIAIDPITNKLYWTNSDLQIQTATLDGEDISTVIQLEEEILETIKRSCSAGGWFLFLIVPISYGGGCSEEIIETNLTSPTDIALNAADGRLYWTEFSGRIRRVNLDGTGLGTLLHEIGSPYGITVAGHKIYWAEEIDEDSGKIQRANLNGTNVETLATIRGIPTGISIDTEADKIYWANSLGGIQRTNLNGGEVEAVASGISSPGDFVLVPSTRPTTPTTSETPGTTDTTVSISPPYVTSPAVGELLEFSLSLTGGEAVAGYQATVQFDTTALRYISSANGDYLPAGAFFAKPTVKGNRVQLKAASLTEESTGDGTLATLTFEVIAEKASALTLSNVLLSNRTGETLIPKVKNVGDVNSDGTVNIADLVTVASNFNKIGENDSDVNGDGVVDIADLVLVAGAFGDSAAAPALQVKDMSMFTATDVKQWLSAAQQLELTDATSKRGIMFLQQLLVALTPKETALLANYPNPFNPETWIPYQLAKPADVKLTIYDINGHVVRALDLGHQRAGIYRSRSRAAHWDGRNGQGEIVASGVYFYTITADDFSATRKMLIRK